MIRNALIVLSLFTTTAHAITDKELNDVDYADRIVRAYMKRYATERRLGRKVTQEDIARIHNGGPNGYKKESTEKYWSKVKKILNG